MRRYLEDGIVVLVAWVIGGFFCAIEAAVLDLRLSVDGEPLLAPEAIAVIATAFGPEWTDWEDRFEARKILPSEYCSGILQLVDGYRRRRFHQRVAERLEELYLDQRELDVFPRQRAG